MSTGQAGWYFLHITAFLFQMNEFRTKMNSAMPQIPKKPIEEQERNDFESVQEFVDYLIDQDEQSKTKKS